MQWGYQLHCAGFQSLSVCTTARLTQLKVKTVHSQPRAIANTRDTRLHQCDRNVDHVILNVSPSQPPVRPSVYTKLPPHWEDTQSIIHSQ